VNGKKPNKQEQKWINAIKEYGCVICKKHRGVFTTPEIHHTTGGNNHIDALPICFFDHNSRLRNDEVVSRHPYKAEFARRYGSDAELLEFMRAEIGNYD